ncbi:hypothetical protein ASPBRDRAFT_532683 [Aspergillus brasiliensis CBS 101740]|uniref:Uncharacterized protein n=1 Tax=Aspergillus brasiliensis (strain CBS 101740 / IMI 381727 / IBT 21946) TaxID=767769 RepID=A0A1L9U1X9_ASPBC|nr:hypothetical protein ASPBRDRAFT_532683 [Aspergillus brasiliensis CBS 101740]
MPTPESPYFFPVPSVVVVGIFHGYLYLAHVLYFLVIVPLGEYPSEANSFLLHHTTT